MALHFVSPQLATHSSRFPTGADWIYERKYDGYRLQAIVEGSHVRLLTRSGLDWSPRFPAIVRELQALGADAILDGEVCVLGADDVTDLAALASGIHHNASVVYFVFDIMHARGLDLTDMHLAERYRVLEDVLGQSSIDDQLIRRVPHVPSHDGRALFETMRRRGHEGVVAKRLDGPYATDRRSPAWLKIKCRKVGHFVVTGWVADHDRQIIKSLRLAARENGVWEPRGHVGTGFSDKVRRSLYERWVSLGSDRRTSRPTDFPDNPSHVSATARVEYLEVTKSGRLREPVLFDMSD